MDPERKRQGSAQTVSIMPTGILILRVSGGHLRAGRAEVRTLLHRGRCPAGAPVVLLLKPSWSCASVEGELISTAGSCDFFEGC